MTLQPSQKLYTFCTNTKDTKNVISGNHCLLKYIFMDIDIETIINIKNTILHEIGTNSEKKLCVAYGRKVDT